MTRLTLGLALALTAVLARGLDATAKIPPLRDGDLILQRSRSAQRAAVAADLHRVLEGLLVDLERLEPRLVEQRRLQLAGDRPGAHAGWASCRSPRLDASAPR